MATVTIMLAPREVMREFFFDKKQIELVRTHLPNYEIAGSYEWPHMGEDAAEEAFDLTNNPSRQTQRAKEYGRGRSVSTGDVIDVDGVKYVCMSMGWQVL